MEAKFIHVDLRRRQLDAEAELQPGEVMNIGFGQRISINDLVVKIARVMKLERLKPEYRERSKADFQDTEADNTKARKVLGWNPEVELDAGLKIFLDWFNSTSWAFERIARVPFGCFLVRAHLKLK